MRTLSTIKKANIARLTVVAIPERDRQTVRWRSGRFRLHSDASRHDTRAARPAITRNASENRPFSFVARRRSTIAARAGGCGRRYHRRYNGRRSSSMAGGPILLAAWLHCRRERHPARNAKNPTPAATATAASSAQTMGREVVSTLPRDRGGSYG